MITYELRNQENTKIGNIDLQEEIFQAKSNPALLHQVVVAYLANQRQGTAKTKEKGEVRGGGKKPFRQKGTGNARQGSTRSPLNPGGGQNFGPRPRDYSQATPKKMVVGALKVALSARCAEQKMIVVDGWKSTGKTKDMFAALTEKFKLKNVLVVDDKNDALRRSVKNLKDANYSNAEMVNPYEVVRHEWVLITKQAVEKLHERLGKASQ